MLPGPGWYPDPANPAAGQRWWDGTQWTPHAAPYGPGPTHDLETEQRSANSARVALLAGAGLYVVQFVVVSLVYHSIWSNFQHTIDDAQNGTTTRSAFPGLQGGLLVGQGALQLASIGLLAVGVVFLVWFHRAATVSRAAGLPARYSPGWAVGAWFIPFANWFMPYQAAVDMLPHDHPQRVLVARWWALWLGTQFSALFVALASLASVGLGLAVALVGAVLAVSAAAAGREVVALVTDTHARLFAR
ncbi:MAG TPA: DUF4328 domain-containing protein [Acidimicrobiales bacterium]|nr:DUF4328 domain-containing protein [Acidimicrobiales bacterium]